MGDKENRVYDQVIVPGVIGEAAIKTNKGSLRKFEGFGPADLMHLAAGHVHESGDKATGIQPHVQFNGPFFLPKLGPRKHGQAEIDHRGIQGIELALEGELVFGSNQLHRLNSRANSI